MATNKAIVTLTGTNNILLHNGQTADPRNKFAKEMKAISGKRKKTDADLDQLAKVEWLAGLYLGSYAVDGVKYATTTIPSHVLESAFIAGAKKSKRGVQTKSGLFVEQDAILDFDGKPEGHLVQEALQAALEELYASDNYHLTVGVRVGMSKVMRTRPMFTGWSASTEVEFDDSILTFSDVKEIIEDSGRLVGVGDWRPKFGRFSAQVELV